MIHFSGAIWAAQAASASGNITTCLRTYVASRACFTILLAKAARNHLLMESPASLPFDLSVVIVSFNTRDMLREGAALPRMVDPELRVTLELFSKGGDAILDGIAAQDYDVLRGRPVVTRRKKLMLLLGALVGKLRMGRGAGVSGA